MKPKWTYSELVSAFDQLLPRIDPDDPKQRKRLRILKAATEHFAQHGYRKASMSEIAQSAGVAKGTLYLYFKTKNELLVHAIAEEKRSYLGRLMPILRDDVPPRVRLKTWLRTVLVLSNEMPLISRLMRGDREIFLVLEELNADMRDRSLEIQRAFVIEMLELAARPHRWTPSELADRAKVLFGIIYSAGLIIQEQVRSGLSVERYAELFAELIVEGIGSAGPHDASSPREGEPHDE